MVRRWMREAVKANFASEKPYSQNKGGRPIKIYFITAKGVYELFSKNKKLPEISHYALNHHIMLNDFWCWVQSNCKDSFSIHPSLSLKEHTHSLEIETNLGKKSLIPDGVLTVSRGDKTLLHFVEIDRGTEPLQRHAGSELSSIQLKLDLYRLYRAKHFTFDVQFPNKFTGFRVLFLADSETRHQSLCRFVSEQEFTDFFWCASFSGMDADLAWAKGGDVKRHYSLW